MKRAYSLLLWLWKALPLPRWSRWSALWLLNTKFLVGVVGGIFDEQERVLIVRHTYCRHHPWGLPGGWVGGNEKLERALARELREETGFEVAVGEVFHVRSGYPRPQVDLYFLCEYRGGEFLPDAAIDAFRFCRLDELPMTILPSQPSVIKLGFAPWRERNDGSMGGRGGIDERSSGG
jgi:ADP-ribose pyrophosphatase YjhB (NUDIX family)